MSQPPSRTPSAPTADLEKDPALIVHEAEAFNAEVPAELLVESFRTPLSRLFVRNHGDVPDLDPEGFRLRVEGRVRRPLELSLADLGRFERREVTSVLQCAGNRRDELDAVSPVEAEVIWRSAAVGNVRWGGVSLADVLAEAGVEPMEAGGEAGALPAGHVAFAGADRVSEDGETFGFGGSIPLAKALSPEVLLADTADGRPLPRLHGGPLRVVVPGYIGARQVKWLTDIRVQDEPSDNHFQTRAYRTFPPHVGPEEADWARGLELGEHPVHAVVCSPAPGARVAAGEVEVAGYALAGGGRGVARVEVSTDGGESWHRAELGEGTRWSWRLWRVRLRLGPGEVEIAARAWDTAGQTQPEHAGPIWNFKGYVNSAWHRRRLEVG